MAKIKIITDSTADVSPAVAEKLGIHIIPIRLTIDGENFIRDTVDISGSEFYRTIRDTGVVPKTTQILPFEFEETLRLYEDEYDEIIMLILSSAASGTYRNAVMAADEVNADGRVKVHMFDGRSFSFGYGAIAVRAAELANEGKTSEEILAAADKMRQNQRLYFTVETLDYLKKGGRISTMSAVIGGMLDIRPIITVKDGLVAATDKVKGEKKLYTRIACRLREDMEQIGECSVYLLVSDAPETQEKMRSALEAEGIKIDGINEVGSVIGCHAGPGVIGVMAVTNKI